MAERSTHLFSKPKVLLEDPYMYRPTGKKEYTFLSVITPILLCIIGFMVKFEFERINDSLSRFESSLEGVKERAARTEEAVTYLKETVRK